MKKERNTAGTPSDTAVISYSSTKEDKTLYRGKRVLTRNQLKQRKGRRFRMGFMIAATLIVMLFFTPTGTKKPSAPADEVAVEPLPISTQIKLKIRAVQSISPIMAPFESAVAPIPELTLALESEPEIPTYDLKLAEELQLYTYDTCVAYGVEDYYELFLSLMWSESSYQTDVISKTNDYGLMQINRGNHKWLSAELGIIDFLDAEQNIEAGVYMLSSFLLQYDDVHKALMCYNMGPGRAAEAWSSGCYSTSYSRKVVNNWETILLGGTLQ